MGQIKLNVKLYIQASRAYQIKNLPFVQYCTLAYDPAPPANCRFLFIYALA